MKKQTIIALLSIIILFNIFLAYSPHFSNPYPLLTDEYVHISIAKLISEEHRLPYTHPYFYPTQLGNPEGRIKNLESGFHYLLATIFIITPGEEVIYYKYLIILFMIINSLLVFYLAKLIFKNNIVALLSTLFFGTIPSTGNFMAHNYFVPLTFGITLLLILSILFYKHEKSKSNKYLIYLIITLLITAISYPPTLTFFFLVILTYLISTEHEHHKKFNTTKKQFLKYLTYLILSAIILLVVLNLITSGSLLNFLSTNLIFDDSWTNIQSDLSPIFFFGLIPTLFAIIGLIYMIHGKENKIIFFWILISIIEIYLFTIFKITILVPFRRLFLFYLIGISISAGVGIVATIGYIKKYTKSKNLVMIAIGIIAILLLFHLVSTIQNQPDVQSILTTEEYEALKFIKETYKERTRIFTDPLTAVTTTPVANNYIMGMITSNIDGRGIQPSKIANAISKGDCELLKRITQSLDAKEITPKGRSTLILTETKITCETPKINLIYDKKVKVYEVTLT